MKASTPPKTAERVGTELSTFIDWPDTGLWEPGTENCCQRGRHKGRKVSRVSLVLAHDSAAARTNTEAEPRI
jgi:hypothetical protein